MNLREKIEQNLIVFFLATVVGSFAAGIGAYEVTLRMTGQQTMSKAELETDVRSKVNERMARFEYTKPLFALLPNDIDFLVRGIHISLEKDSAVSVSGPEPRDSYRIAFSNVEKQSEGAWHATVRIDGVLGDNKIGDQEFPIDIRSGAYSGAMQAVSHELFVAVEDVNPDGVVTLALARRKIGPGATIRDNLVEGWQGNAFTINVGPRPEPILCKKPN
jgi:hypothetical protein